MKELYSFNIKRKIKEKVPVEKENAKGEIVKTHKVKTKTLSNRVFFAKPNFSDIEEAEFFYGQKYNEFINAGYLTRSMLTKKIGDAGGTSSKLSEDLLSKTFVENLEASKVIEFYDEQKDLTEEQQEKLEEAKRKFVATQKFISEYEEFHRSQFSQTAEAKSETKLMEWFIFNFSYYEEEFGEKKEQFPLFVGETFEDKREHYLALNEDEEDIKDKDLLKNKSIFDESFGRLAKVANIWYNKLGTNQKEISQSLKDIFGDE